MEDNNSESDIDYLINMYDEDVDDFIEEDANEIVYYEEDHYEEAVDKHYYIGMSYPLKTESSQINILASRIRPETFFKYNILTIHYYLSQYNLFCYNELPSHNKKIDIMQLIILEDQTYAVVIKTHWIRLIQRKWRNVMKNREINLRKRCSLKSLQFREITGKFPKLYDGGLIGLLGNISNTRTSPLFQGQ
jgi:hypothetical protein